MHWRTASSTLTLTLLLAGLPAAVRAEPPSAETRAKLGSALKGMKSPEKTVWTWLAKK